MDSHNIFLLAILLVLATFVDETRGDAMVTGTVYCDQCKDGGVTFLDYPLYGVKVDVTCEVGSGLARMTNSDTTNLFGSYTVRFTGSSLANPDVRNCNAQITGFGQGSNSCGAVPGPAKPIRLMFSMYDMEIYTVDALLSQPSEPLAFCPRSATPLPNPVSTPPSIPPPFNPVTPPSLTNPINPTTPPSPPTVRLPPMPFLESSACPYQKWTMPEYRCHWSVVEPDTKVAVAFGLIAARKYGTDMTLRKGLQGRGDVYRTLLREATTALLNSYNSIHFGYPTLSVIGNMNAALMGSPRHALFMALRFKRANSGYGTVRCNFTPCK